MLERIRVEDNSLNAYYAKQLYLDYLSTIASKIAEIGGLKKGKEQLEGEINVLYLNRTAAENEA